jgi:hypothetical protein
MIEVGNRKIVRKGVTPLNFPVFVSFTKELISPFAIPRLLILSGITMKLLLDLA